MNIRTVPSISSLSPDSNPDTSHLAKCLVLGRLHCLLSSLCVLPIFQQIDRLTNGAAVENRLYATVTSTLLSNTAGHSSFCRSNRNRFSATQLPFSDTVPPWRGGKKKYRARFKTNLPEFYTLFYTQLHGPLSSYFKVEKLEITDCWEILRNLN